MQAPISLHNTAVQNTLREPGSCKLRTSAGDLLPVTTKPNDAGKHFLVAGDVRVNEHGVLAAMHTVWVREHNRLCDALAEGEFATLSEDEKFTKARKVRCQILVVFFLVGFGRFGCGKPQKLCDALSGGELASFSQGEKFIKARNAGFECLGNILASA